MSKRIRSIVGVMVGLLILTGCATGPAPHALTSPNTVPPDFSLVFFVDSPSGRQVNITHRRALYLLDAAGSLHVALGPGVTEDIYPPTTARLTPEQVAKVYHLTRAAGLISSAEYAVPHSSATSPSTVPSAVYRITVTVYGNRYRQNVPAGQSAKVGKLLRELAKLSGLR